MADNKRVFISFDIEHDSACKELLVGQAKNEDSPFDFKDASVKEHLSGDWKDKVRRRFDNVDIVIFLCGTQTHTATGVAHEYAIAIEKKMAHFCLAAYSEKSCTRPAGAEGEKLYKWTWDNLKNLIGGGR